MLLDHCTKWAGLDFRAEHIQVCIDVRAIVIVPPSLFVGEALLAGVCILVKCLIARHGPHSRQIRRVHFLYILHTILTVILDA